MVRIADRAPQWPALSRCVAFVVLCLLFHATPGSAQESTADQPAPASVEDMKGPLYGAYRRTLRRERRARFFRDARLQLHARTYYLDWNDPNTVDSHALAQGFALSYRSGWLRDRFSVGADLYSSLRISGENEELTLLLDGDDSFAVLGQAYGKMRFGEQYVALYRRRLELPYVNANDHRMVPNTFEAYTLKGELGETFKYIAGHVTKIKPRNSDDFIHMSEWAGAGGSKGLTMAGLLWSPGTAVHIGGINHFTDDTLNIFYGEAEYTRSLGDEVAAKVGLQFTDQRSVGDHRLTGSSFDTQVFGGQIAGSFRNAVLRAAFSSTASEERIRSPWGSYPGYIGLMQRDFNRAGEDAWLIGLSYDFRNLGVEGLSAFANYAEGSGARNPETGESRPDQREVDLTVDYRLTGTWASGLWIRLRGSTLDREGEDEIRQVRIIINYDMPII